MSSQQQLKARFDAFKSGDFSHLQAPGAYKNYNLSSGDQVINQDHGYNLPPERKIINNYKGLYAKVYSDNDLKRAYEWLGSNEQAGRLLYACVRDYGIHRVKEAIVKVGRLGDGYFKPQYGPILTQRGKILNAEMKKLRP